MQSCVDLGIPKSLQRDTNMLQMFFLHLREDQDVIQIDKDERIQLLRKHFVHQVLKGCRSVREPKWHHQKFEMVSMRPERSLRYIIFFTGYLMITGGQIDGGKVFGFSQSIPQIIDSRQWGTVLNG